MKKLMEELDINEFDMTKDENSPLKNINTSKCVHIDNIESFSSEDLEKKCYNPGCVSCEEKKENWMCLKCGKLFCGVKKNGHMKDHYFESGHCLFIYLTNFNFWCFKCNKYVSNDDFIEY
jgi:uncharacterized UBP type Zn finger protein